MDNILSIFHLLLYHYKALVQHEMSSKVHAQQLTAIMRCGIVPEMWSVPLQVLLEKICSRNVLGEKMRYIQLYEADFNYYRMYTFTKMGVSK